MNVLRVLGAACVVLAVWTRLAAADPPPASLDERIADIFEQNRLSVVFIRVTVKEPSGKVTRIIGSGVIISGAGHILTASHLLSVADDPVIEVSIGSIDGDVFRAERVPHDINDYDVTLIKLVGAHGRLRPADLGDPEYLRVGYRLVALGFPLGERFAQASERIGALDGPNEMWQVAIPLNFGNSGGPAFDLFGTVVGIVKGGISEAQGMNFIVPLKFAYALLDKAGVQRPTPRSEHNYPWYDEGPPSGDQAGPIGFSIDWSRLPKDRDSVRRIVPPLLKGALDRSLKKVDVSEVEFQDGTTIEDRAKARKLAHFLKGELVEFDDGPSIMFEWLRWTEGRWVRAGVLFLPLPGGGQAILDEVLKLAHDFREKVEGVRVILVWCFFPNSDVKSARQPLPLLPELLPGALVKPLTSELTQEEERKEKKKQRKYRAEPTTDPGQCRESDVTKRQNRPTNWSGDLFVQGTIAHAPTQSQFHVEPTVIVRGSRRAVPLSGFARDFVPNDTPEGVAEQLAAHMRRKWSAVQEAETK